MAVLAQAWMRAVQFPAANVFGARNRFNVARIDTATVAAQMVRLVAIRHRPTERLKRHARRRSFATTNLDMRVATTPDCSSPIPTPALDVRRREALKPFPYVFSHRYL
jgi:hypothetical protein